MQTRLNPYISFRDEARAAMTFYQTVFGGELAIDTFGVAHATDDPAD
jgi:PhnB protein